MGRVFVKCFASIFLLTESYSFNSLLETSLLVWIFLPFFHFLCTLFHASPQNEPRYKLKVFRTDRRHDSLALRKKLVPGNSEYGGQLGSKTSKERKQIFFRNDKEYAQLASREKSVSSNSENGSQIRSKYIGHILDELSLSTHPQKSEQTYYLSCACNSSSDDIFIKLIDDFFSKYLNSFHRVKITSGLFQNMIFKLCLQLCV